jgi:hypothetical protein
LRFEAVAVSVAATAIVAIPRAIAEVVRFFMGVNVRTAARARC